MMEALNSLEMEPTLNFLSKEEGVRSGLIESAAQTLDHVYGKPQHCEDHLRKLDVIGSLSGVS